MTSLVYYAIMQAAWQVSDGHRPSKDLYSTESGGRTMKKLISMLESYAQFVMMAIATITFTVVIATGQLPTLITILLGLYQAWKPAGVVALLGVLSLAIYAVMAAVLVGFILYGLTNTAVYHIRLYFHHPDC